MGYVLLAFVLSFIQNYIATLEVYNIARVKPWQASILAGLNAFAAWIIVVLVIVQTNRFALVGATILGDIIATYVALSRVKNGKH